MEMKAEPQKEHQWLAKLIGDWTYESEAMMEPDKPDYHTGTESIRSLGGLWMVAEGSCEIPGGGSATTLMSLGYDPRKQKFVGTWVGSMMTNLWVYEGELDEKQTALTLETAGPSCMTGEGGMGKYRDVIEFLNDDHRTLSSYAQGDDGTWQRFMTAHYKRKK